MHLHVKSEHFYEKDNVLLDTHESSKIERIPYGHDMLHKARKQSWLDAKTKK